MKSIRSYWREGLTAIGVLFFTFLALQVPFLQGVAESFDMMVFRHQPISPAKDIVIVGLDDKTLNNPDFKRFQDIDRADYAQVLTTILEGNPRTVGVDVFFFNESENKAEDNALKEVLQAAPQIVIAEEFDDESNTFRGPADTLGATPDQLGTIPLSGINESHVENMHQIDFWEGDKTHEPFAIRLWRKWHGADKQKALSKPGVPWYTLISGQTKKVIPIERNGNINSNFFGGPESYKMLSFYKVWKGDVPAKDFEDKVVLIGATAHDVHDEYFTPTARKSRMAGVEIHANAFQTIRDGAFLRYYTPLQQWIWGALGVFLLLGAVLSLPLWGALGVLLFLSVGTYVLMGWLYVNGVVGSWFWPCLMMAVFFAAVYMVRFWTTDKQKQFLKQTFGRYVAPGVVTQLMDDPSSIVLEGEERPLALWFSDIVNFTNKSEKLSPQDTVRLLNIYLGEVAPLILESGGTIDKFLGDGIMAFWGAPISLENESLRACQTALGHQKKLKQVNVKLVNEGLPSLDVRIGLHTDLVRVGNIGTQDRLEYTAIGDGVNLASRLEGVNKAYGTHIIISETVAEEAAEDVFSRELDTIRVKGKDLGIRVFELLCHKGDETKEQKIRKETYEKGLAYYREQEWEEARTWFAVLKDDPASQTMLERIKSLKKQKLPEDWDGVYVFEVK